MRKISFAGLLLGAMLGVIVALIFGKWLFWLGMGLVIGIFVGTACSRWTQSLRLRQGAKL